MICVYDIYTHSNVKNMDTELININTRNNFGVIKSKNWRWKDVNPILTVFEK